MNLDSNRREVMAFLESNFVSLEKMTLEAFKFLPGGILVTDQNNDKMIFYYDIEANKVKWMDELSK